MGRLAAALACAVLILSSISPAIAVTLRNLTEVQSPGNNAATYHTTSYDYTTDGTYGQSEALGQPITVTDTLGNVTHLRYDSQANLESETDALGNEWQASVNLANQVTEIEAPATGNTGTGNATTVPTYLYVGGPTTTETAYDESGSAVRSVSYTYGLDGETLGVSGDAETTSVTYGSPYWIKSLTDGNSHTTSYTHGSSSVPLSGDVTKVSYPRASGGYDTMIYVYNVMHAPTQRTDGNSVVTNYSYSDGDGLLSAIAYPGSTSLNVGITYDGYDRAYYVSDGTGSITDSFDDLNETTQSVRAYTGLSSKTLTYSRYPDGTRSAMTTPAGNFSYDYDKDGHYTQMTSPAGTFGATYYDNGWQETRYLSNGLATGYEYNAVGALTTLETGSTSSFTSFSYDGVFNMTGFSANYGSGSTLPNGARTFGFDAKDRLTASSIPTSSTTTATSSYGFDYAGNRTLVNGVTIPFNSDNQNSGGGYGFEGNGNPTSYNGTSLSFDPENRVTAVGSTSTASYRADGLRAKKTVGSTTTYYLYDRGAPIIELNSSGTVTGLNFFAPDGLVARTAGSTTTEYVFDQQGNVADRTNTSGAVQSVTQYDGWGNEQAISGTPTDPFGYNAQWGYYLDRETGLYLCQHRLYDPANGRWLNRDPIGYSGGTNLYGYCAAGPTVGFDANGYGYREQWDFYKNGGFGPPTQEACEWLRRALKMIENSLIKWANRGYDIPGGDPGGKSWGHGGASGVTVPGGHLEKFYTASNNRYLPMRDLLDSMCGPPSDPGNDDCPDGAPEPLPAPDPAPAPVPAPAPAPEPSPDTAPRGVPSWFWWVLLA